MKATCLYLTGLVFTFCFLVNGLKLNAAAAGASTAGRSSATGRSIEVGYADWHDLSRNRLLPVKIYRPRDVSRQEPYPVVVFSHGLGGSREAASYLGSYLAENGYVCFFIQHPGSDESFWRGRLRIGEFSGEAVLKEFRSVLLNPIHALNRARDVHFALDQIEELNQSDPDLAGQLDLNAIAIAGHSYGAWTALTAAGQHIVTPAGRHFSSVDQRVKAAIYLSPTSPRKGQHASQVLGEILVPGLHLTGTKDDSPMASTAAMDRRAAFDAIRKSDQYLMTLNGGDHMVFNGRPRRLEKSTDKAHQETVKKLCVAFLDAYLKNDARSLSWLKHDATGALASQGVFEAKTADP